MLRDEKSRVWPEFSQCLDAELLQVGPSAFPKLLAYFRAPSFVQDTESGPTPHSVTVAALKQF